MYKEISFIVDTEVYVDWGDSINIKYQSGTITGTPSGRVKVRSAKETSRITFVNDAAKKINISVATSLTTLQSSCLNATNLEQFNMTGVNAITSLNSAWSGCTNLTKWDASSMSYVTDVSRAWQDTTSLEKIGRINTREGELFYEAFKNSGVKCIGLLDTTNQTDTTDMFIGTDLVKPDNLERDFLLAGGRYLNDTDCDANGIVCTEGINFPGLEF